MLEFVPLGVSVLAILYAIVLAQGVARAPAGTRRMQEISAAIREGAFAYLRQQYKTIGIAAVIIAVLIAAFVDVATAVAFLAGAFLSALAGFIGMNVGTLANVRTTAAAEKSLDAAIQVAFKGGTVMGLVVVALGLAGVSAFYLAFGSNLTPLFGFGFGASLIALFARVGGGIYTKAADVGADLVGKVEAGIPEDDPRNPAVIADNVGDNVGDIAGMGADLFESYSVTLIAAMILGSFMFPGQAKGILFPLVLGAATIVASIIGTFFVRGKENEDPLKALNKGTFATVIAAFLFLAAVIPLVGIDTPNILFVSAVGLAVTLAAVFITEHYTSTMKRHVQHIAKVSETGAATNIIAGLAVGMRSTTPFAFIVAAGILSAYYAAGGLADPLAGVYGISIAALAMLSMTGIIVAVDSFGPITDNAGGIAEMSGLGKNVRRRTDILDAVGNTTKAVTKGFAIGSAALAAISLFAAFNYEVERFSGSALQLDLLNPLVVVGMFLGGASAFIFSSMLMNAVGRAANQMVSEVRRQFRDKGIMKGTRKPDYARCVQISTAAAQRELLLPALVGVAVPLGVGLLLGVKALGGVLAGVILAGFLLGITLTNAGGAWDNAKKLLESKGLKGTPVHAAAVIGDTVGDPAKDTAGPSLNALIKVMNTISILFASAFVAYSLVKL
jgi:K(+)-stimulated pyrophosphate-energized sodium pump